MNINVKELVKDVHLDKDSKKELTKCRTRADLTLALSKCLFKRRVTSKPNYEEHDKLNYLIDDKAFDKNVKSIIKKL